MINFKVVENLLVESMRTLDIICRSVILKRNWWNVPGMDSTDNLKLVPN